MIREYIDQLQEENRERLHAFDREMQELTQDLTENERLLTTLQAQKQDDKNIFSPRSVDSGADEEIRKTQEEIGRLKQRMDYVSKILESEVKNRDEYAKLAEEAAKEEKQAGGAKAESDKPKADKAETDKAEIAKAESGNADAQTEDSRERKDNRELIDFLDSVYKKVQFSISLVNGNKNRCRSELKNVGRMIQNYKENLQEPENE